MYVHTDVCISMDVREDAACSTYALHTAVHTQSSSFVSRAYMNLLRVGWRAVRTLLFLFAFGFAGSSEREEEKRREFLAVGLICYKAPLLYLPLKRRGVY